MPKIPFVAAIQSQIRPCPGPIDLKCLKSRWLQRPADILPLVQVAVPLCLRRNGARLATTRTGNRLEDLAYEEKVY